MPVGTSDAASLLQKLREFKSMDVGHSVPAGLSDGELV